MSIRAVRLLVGLAVLATLLPGCGGGSGTGPGPGTVPPPGATMTAAEQQMGMDALAAMNARRAGLGLAAYVWYQNGANVAYQHCLRMEAGSFFAHVDPGTGTDPATRALNAGITHDPQGLIDPTSGNPFVGENLAMATGFPTVTYTGQEAVDGWVGSPGHRTQIDAPLPVPGAQTMPPWTHCGIGVRVTTTEIWYTAMFFRNPMP
jgi:uncharacterized protein YkwD